MPKISRRSFLGGAVGLAAIGTSLRPDEAAADSGAAAGRILAYVGTFSGPKATGRGIHAFILNPLSGGLEPFAVTAMASSPSSLALAPSGTHLYSANAGANGPSDPNGSVSAFAIDRASGRLDLLNTQSAGGEGPAHLSVHPAGQHVLVANYEGGSVAVLPIRGDGSLGPATDVIRDTGTLGPLQAASGPPGSFAVSGHDAPHAHMILSDPTGRHVISTDLGLDRIYVWKFDPAAGKLRPGDPPFASVPPGDGPRHFAFHPNGRWFYSLQEEGSTLSLFDYADGRLTPRQSLTTLPPDFAGTSFASEVVVSSDGRFVYAANRFHDTIAIFAIGPDGTVKRRGEEWTRGDYPRHFDFDPTGRFLHVCNHHGDSVTTFRVDRARGGLTFTGQYTPVGSPSIIVFLKLPTA